MPGDHSNEISLGFNLTRTLQLMGALAYLHSKKIAHRDLKPENFLLVEHTSIQSAVVKIADFGFACHAENSNGLHGLCGSPGYVAPEILKEEGGYGLPVDMWSMGVILYILLSGIPPFAGESDEESFAMTIRGYYDNSVDDRSLPVGCANGGSQCLNEVSSAGQDLVAKMLTYNPAKVPPFLSISLMYQSCFFSASPPRIASSILG